MVLGRNFQMPPTLLTATHACTAGVVGDQAVRLSITPNHSIVLQSVLHSSSLVQQLCESDSEREH